MSHLQTLVSHFIKGGHRDALATPHIPHGVGVTGRHTLHGENLLHNGGNL